ncbi:MAG: type II toxin-antitoxin system HicB family antitoxin [Methylobacterium sp.]|jgi:antitoxin HicB|nr:type II toxin-antitoxin system HicB family antitoxin [Methylobacterium sp.]MCA3602177.1 type II toxin-antitoxin system HicB family antitoxin [Methylobacterium sp.]MCA3613245.1 type II toxin-antitoxin system HicB family antitoxin [Methylobacterium sp.]MCA3614954.1 type II toxin-antitoxin system HicB family antitoxin [Methylobacterium sp.]MCA4910758.1 type II toxin-antitoxin system HicB family antitoxin [Methylobacterium sp.]
MAHYIAMVHKENDSCYGVSFAEFPGQITAADSLDEAVERASSLLSFIADGWETGDGPFPEPRTIDELRKDPEFLEDSAEAILIAVPLPRQHFRPAAE